VSRGRLLVAVLMVAVLLVPALGTAQPLFMWRADRDGATLYLFGTVHAGRDAWYPLDARIEAAFAAAETVACEIDVSNPTVALEVSALAMREGTYPPGESLRQHVAAATWERLQTLPGLPVPAAMLDRLRPGLAALLVVQSMLSTLGLDPARGVDQHLLERAKELEKPVVALETPAQQVALIVGPDAVIDGLLLDEALAEDPAEMQAMFGRLLAAWRDGDPATLERIYREDWSDESRLVRFHEKLLVERNRGMADGLAGRRGTWFLVVGALHLCGDEGVPALIARRGWSVAQVR